MKKDIREVALMMVPVAAYVAVVVALAKGWIGF